MSQRILYNLAGQTLRHVPPTRVQAPVTYAIEDLTRADDAADRVLASGAATVASWSCTTSAVAGPTASSSSRITVATTTGAAIGDPAAIVAADGTAEIFTVDAISTDTYLEAEAPLAGTYASASTVYGIEVSAAVPLALYGDEDILDQRRPLRVVWTYTVGGQTIKAQETIEFQRHNSAALLDVGAAILRVRNLYPDLAERLPSGATLDRLAPALADEIADDLRQRSIEPERWMTGSAGEQLLFLRIVAHAGDLGYAPGATDAATGAWAAAARGRYRERLESLTIGEAGHGALVVDHVADTSDPTSAHVYRGPTLRM